MNADRRSRLERILALARLSLALLAALVLRLEPETTLTDPVLPTLVMAYTLYAWVAAVAVAVMAREVGVAGLVLHCLDVLWALVITSTIEGPANAFFVFFVFALVGAAYRWGLRETVATGLATAALLLAYAWLAAEGLVAQSRATLFSHVIIQSGYTAGLAVLIGYLAEEQHRARADSATAARVFAALHLRSGLRIAVHAVLRVLVDALGTRGAILTFEEVGTRRMYEYSLPSPGSTLRVLERPCEEGHRISGRFSGPSRVYRLRRRRRYIELADDRGRRRISTDPSMEHAPGGWRTLLVGEMPVGHAWAGRLVLVDPESVTDARARRWLAGLLPQMGLALYSAYLLGRLRSRATAMERSRLARELHDGVIQSLIALEMHVDVLRRRLENDQASLAGELADVQQRLRQEVLNVRDLMQQIRPVQVDPRDVPGRLAELCERLHREAGIDARFVCDLTDLPIAPRQARELVRIAQEALVNVRKHSGARTVVLRLGASDRGCVLTIDDDGKGFEFEGQQSLDQLDAARRGPLVIKERVRLLGGTLVLDSAPGRGARLEIAVPRRLV